MYSYTIYDESDRTAFFANQKEFDDFVSKLSCERIKDIYVEIAEGVDGFVFWGGELQELQDELKNTNLCDLKPNYDCCVSE